MQLRAASLHLLSSCCYHFEATALAHTLTALFTLEITVTSLYLCFRHLLISCTYQLLHLPIFNPFEIDQYIAYLPIFKINSHSQVHLRQQGESVHDFPSDQSTMFSR